MTPAERDTERGIDLDDRAHLSIGEVLALLQDEFPDVTISKIRFLESQGLLDPERTPSGYRKFYDPDVARLRWILEQQREHFLPLRVIKDRLDRGDWSPGTTTGPDGSSAVGE
ncbi:MAG TPA: MerR family transcriptional regulator, partial [Acidimicrobiales bacterium]|nr:MerR family transcriptional regulator [Acidimicrobiales bacterium]